jgi:hypothetical protein
MPHPEPERPNNGPSDPGRLLVLRPDQPQRWVMRSGECERRGDDLGGIAVHIGARVADCAGPGEVLVSGRPCLRVRHRVRGQRCALVEGRSRRVATVRSGARHVAERNRSRHQRPRRQRKLRPAVLLGEHPCHVDARPAQRGKGASGWRSLLLLRPSLARERNGDQGGVPGQRRPNAGKLNP